MGIVQSVYVKIGQSVLRLVRACNHAVVFPLQKILLLVVHEGSFLFVLSLLFFCRKLPVEFNLGHGLVQLLPASDFALLLA